jgi:hypothetical protein
MDNVVLAGRTNVGTRTDPWTMTPLRRGIYDVTFPDPSLLILLLRRLRELAHRNLSRHPVTCADTWSNALFSVRAHGHVWRCGWKMIKKRKYYYPWEKFFFVSHFFLENCRILNF